jgi:oxygen-independent coproporphyrinogen-3 oxidase
VHWKTSHILLQLTPGMHDGLPLLQELLHMCGRSHSLDDVYTAIDAVKAAGFPSWSLDLISGLPKLTTEVWQHSLNEAIAAGPDHISIYDLQVLSAVSM